MALKDSELGMLEERAQACEDLHADVIAMDNLNRDVKDLESKLRALREKGDGALDDMRSPEEHRQEEETTAKALGEARKKVESWQQKELDAGREINRLEKECNELQQEILSVEKRQQESATLDAKKAKLEKDVEEVKEEQKELAERMQSLEEDEKARKREKNKLISEKEHKADV